jgi:hypothetical protein
MVYGVEENKKTPRTEERRNYRKFKRENTS